jgi:hypothetical protein
MRPRSRTGLVLASALAAALSLATCRAAEPTPYRNWRTLSRGRVTVLFQDADRAAGARVLEIAAPAAARLSAELGGAPPAVLRLIIAPTEADFVWLGDGRIPDWGVGWADPERARVVIKSPRIVSYPLQMESVVVHEVAHVAVGRALGAVQVPRWFDEGVAMAMAGEWDAEETALGAAALAGTAYTLAALEGEFPTGARGAALAYAESREAIRFLMDEGSVPTEAGLVRAVAAGPDFEAALRRIVGRTPGEFDTDFRNHLRRRFGWGVVLEGAGVMMLAATAVFGVAAVRRARRTRRRMRELEAEERLPSPRGRPRTGSSWV